MLHPTFNFFFVTFCQKTKENIADFKKKAMGFLADRCTFVRYLAVDALNNPRTLNYYEKNGFAYLFEDEEQEAVSSKMKLPLKTRYMYFDLIEVIRK